MKRWKKISSEALYSQQRLRRSSAFLACYTFFSEQWRRTHAGEISEELQGGFLLYIQNETTRTIVTSSGFAVSLRRWILASQLNVGDIVQFYYLGMKAEARLFAYALHHAEHTQYTPYVIYPCWQIFLVSTIILTFFLSSMLKHNQNLSL